MTIALCAYGKERERERETERDKAHLLVHRFHIQLGELSHVPVLLLLHPLVHEVP